jgi:uncharacterized protein YkwD
VVVKNRSNIGAFAVALVTSVTLSPAYFSAAEASANKQQPQRPHLQMEQPKEALPPPSPDPKAAPTAKKAGEPGQETYPVIGQLEMVTFGSSRPQLSITDRLSQLEQAIYHQSYPHMSLSERSQQLKDTLLGPSVDPDIRMGGQPEPAPYSPPQFPEHRYPVNPTTAMPTGAGTQQGGIDPRLLETWKQPFFQTVLPRNELEHFALELVNRERSDLGLAQLQWDDVSQRVATTLVDDLCMRDTVSHLNKSGENPDLRYTRAGGNDALSESLATVTGPISQTLNRALVARMVEEMKSHQDDRDSLMSADATHLGFSLGIAQNKDKAIGCAEVVTKHAIMHPIPEQVKVGDKIEVKGVLLQPYRFQKVTIAWEGNLPDSASSQPADNDVPQDEAMPYFPPLDYVAYASRAEHDREKLAMILRTTGVIAAIAGGMFMPPVALAAPLIAMAPVGSGEPKAAADVPVHGGIKLQGSTFSGSVPVSHQGKEGLYYLTIWAAASEMGHPVPISRRTIIVRATEPAVTTSIPIDPPVVVKQSDPEKVDREKPADQESKKEAREPKGGDESHGAASKQASNETEPVRGGQPGSL